jgi:hypothetical protein
MACELQTAQLSPSQGDYDLASFGEDPVPASASPSRDTPAPLARPQRRLPERILTAIHQACDLGDLLVASRLLETLEIVMARTGGQLDGTAAHRRNVEGMVAAYHRLWHLKRDRTAS